MSSVISSASGPAGPLLIIIILTSVLCARATSVILSVATPL